MASSSSASGSSVQTLSDSMSSGLSLTSGSMTKDEAWDYLCVSFVMNVRHSNADRASIALKSVPCFTRLLDPTLSGSIATVMDEDNEFNVESLDGLIVERIQLGFSERMCSFKYLMQCSKQSRVLSSVLTGFDRTLKLLDRVNSTWDLTIPAERQRELASSCQRPLVMFAGLCVTSPDLSDDSDFFQSRQECWSLLISDSKGRTFPAGFLKFLVESMDEDMLPGFIKYLSQTLSKPRDDPSSWADACNAWSKLSSIAPAMQEITKMPEWLGLDPSADSDGVSEASSLDPFGSSPSRSTGGRRQSSLNSAADLVSMMLRSMQGGAGAPGGPAAGLFGGSPLRSRAKKRKVLGRIVQSSSFLGYLLRFDSHIPKWSRELFDGISRKQKSDPRAIHSAFTSFATLVHPLQDGVSLACRNMIRNPENRASLVKYIECVLYLNADRGKMRYKPSEVVSDGFMINFNYSLLLLCDPIIKKAATLKSKIDARFFLAHSQFITDMVSKHMGGSESSSSSSLDSSVSSSSSAMTKKSLSIWKQATLVSGWSSSQREKILQRMCVNIDNDVDFKFTSQIFCFCLESLHLGFSQVQRNVDNGRQQVHRLRSELSGDPFRMAHLDRLEDGLFGEMAHILDERFFSLLCKFYNFFVEWILYLSSVTSAVSSAAMECAKNKGDLRMFELVSVPESDVGSSEVVLERKEEEKKEEEKTTDITSSISSSSPSSSSLSSELESDLNAVSAISMIPEYMIEDLSRFFKIYAQLSPMHSKLSLSKENVLKMIIFLLGKNTPLKNLYLQACLLEICVAFIPNEVASQFHDQRKPDGSMTQGIRLSELHTTSKDQYRSIIYKYQSSHDFNVIPSVMQNLVPVLVRLYKEVERTGSRGQYYEKFKFRNQISEIFKFVFLFDNHKQKLKDIWYNQGESGQEYMVGFLAMIINDLIYNLDAGLNGLIEIKELENERDHQSSISVELTEEEASDLAEKKQQVKFNLQMSCESLDLLTFICIIVGIKPFLHELIAPRMSVLISIYLERLGSKQDRLKVKNITEYNLRNTFRFLLTTIVRLVITLCKVNNMDDECDDGIMFREILVSDELLFKSENFYKAVKFVRKHGLMSEMDVSIYEDIIQDLELRSSKVINLTSLISDIPDRYLDPITYDIMSEPVILTSKDPKSKPFVMERLVIERHLLNDPKNPFTREDLSKEDLVPDKELQKEIEEWKAQKIAEIREQRRREKMME